MQAMPLLFCDLQQFPDSLVDSVQLGCQELCDSRVPSSAIGDETHVTGAGLRFLRDSRIQAQMESV
jgi:hypothetical protein